MPDYPERDKYAVVTDEPQGKTASPAGTCPTCGTALDGPRHCPNCGTAPFESKPTVPRTEE